MLSPRQESLVIASTLVAIWTPAIIAFAYWLHTGKSILTIVGW